LVNFTALFDANVLYPAPLRDLLIELALTGHFRAKWSNSIHDEWINNLLKNRPDLTFSDLDKTRKAMNNAVSDCLVENYENLIPSLKLPDSKDRHVLAAAIRGRADVIVSINVKDFHKHELSKYSISIQHPDDFILDLLNLAPESVYGAIRKIRERLKNPPINIDFYLDNLERNGLTIVVSHLRRVTTIL
jgi:predicted nucleic acid-binding protein